jgi:hypothetical protein
MDLIFLTGELAWHEGSDMIHSPAIGGAIQAGALVGLSALYHDRFHHPPVRNCCLFATTNVKVS